MELPLSVSFYKCFSLSVAAVAGSIKSIEVI